MNKLSCLLTFSLGAAVGSVVSWRVLKTKYEKIAQEEIDSVIETFSNRKREPKETEDFSHVVTATPKKEEEKQNMRDYKTVLSEQGYTNYSGVEESPKPVKKVQDDEPYVIAPEEYNEIEGYEGIELTYYADGVLADDADEIVEDVEGTVGLDFATHYGEYEDDSVHIRNERLKCDYEILRDLRKYSDVKNAGKPPQMEG